MNEFKLVPVEPDGLTDEQIFEIAEPFGAFEFGDAQGDKRLAFARAILAAAHAVQGEPVATIHVDGSFVHVSWHIPAPLRCSMDVYAAPQPPEQKHASDVTALVEALEQCITSMLDSGYRADAVVIRAARSALAAYRKGGSDDE